MYGSGDEAEGIATIHAALERGVTLLDTGDFYSMGKNELLIGKALAGGHRDKALLSVKFGGLRSPDGAFLGFDARPAATKSFLAHSLSRLGVDHIDIYRPARLDPQVPIEDTVGAIGEMVKAGYVRYVGLSEVGVETIRRAAAVHPISDLQIEYGLASRGVEARIIPALRDLGIAMTAYGVLSRGLLTGAKPSGPRDIRAHLPRFAAGNAEKNQPLVEALARVAAAKGVPAAALAMAWVRAKAASHGVTVVPTIGARTRKQITDALASLDVSLDMADVAALEAAVPANQIAGTRYGQEQMAVLDSER
jgi:aryl-alcohol dehydrogenase-like predicted oxidoreductase